MSKQICGVTAAIAASVAPARSSGTISSTKYVVSEVNVACRGVTEHSPDVGIDHNHRKIPAVIAFELVQRPIVMNAGFETRAANQAQQTKRYVTIENLVMKRARCRCDRSTRFAANVGRAFEPRRTLECGPRSNRSPSAVTVNTRPPPLLTPSPFRDDAPQNM